VAVVAFSWIDAAGLAGSAIACSRCQTLDSGTKRQIVAEVANYKSQMLPFMPGRRTVDKERAFIAIFSTMIGAVEIARMLPDPAVRKKVLASTRDFLLRSFGPPRS
jgi:TetR/AcrR family transcriptional repressor of nem operon